MNIETRQAKRNAWKLFIVLSIIYWLFVFSLLSGCVTPYRESGTRIKIGKVVHIDYNNVFGGTFTDYMDVIYFDDGDILQSQNRNLSNIELNRSGIFYFDKNYFEYEGVWYTFDNFNKVEYFDEG